MITNDKLQRIRARCVELLAIAEKRTPGKWEAHGKRLAFWWGDECHSGEWIEGYYLTEANAAYIASCSGAAEAGWKSTIQGEARADNAASPRQKGN